MDGFGYKAERNVTLQPLQKPKSNWHFNSFKLTNFALILCVMLFQHLFTTEKPTGCYLSISVRYAYFGLKVNLFGGGVCAFKMVVFGSGNVV